MLCLTVVMPSSNGRVDGDGEEDAVADAKGINTVFSFTLCNNFKLDFHLDLEVLLLHKYALVHH